MNLKDKYNLKKGQAFVGIDDNKYYFLGYDYNSQIMFTNLDLWTDEAQKYIVKNNLFIKTILDEKSEIIENATWYYQSLSELEKATTEEKIKRCLDIIENSNSPEIELRPTKICKLVRGQAYSKELNQFYEVIGFIVDSNIYIDKKFNTKETGFFSIYHSNCGDSVPLIFERENEDNIFARNKQYIASNGDKVDIFETLLSQEQVNDALTESLEKRLEREIVNERVI